MCNFDETNEQSYENLTETELSNEEPIPQRKHSYHYISGILTFIFLPHFWCLSIPALIFSSESKKMFDMGNISLSIYFSNKARRFIIASWLITLALLVLFALFEVLVYFCL